MEWICKCQVMVLMDILSKLKIWLIPIKFPYQGNYINLFLRIDDAVKRILAVKLSLGIVDIPQTLATKYNYKYP